MLTLLKTHYRNYFQIIKTLKYFMLLVGIYDQRFICKIANRKHCTVRP